MTNHRGVNKNWAIARLRMAKHSYDWGAEGTAFKIIAKVINEMKEAGDW